MWPMKLRLPKASELRKKRTKAIRLKKTSLKTFVTNWLNTSVLPEINDALEDPDYKAHGILVRSPHESYEWGKAFYAEVQKQLKPLGYKSDETHDGGGMYACTYISWAKE